MDNNIWRNLWDNSSFANEQHQRSCPACRDCRAIHDPEPMVGECLLTDCHLCADLERIDDQISSTYNYLSDLINERQKIIRKPRHDALIHRMPVEILSSIFVIVNEAILDYRFSTYPGHVVAEPPFQQPSQSPPLLVGAVCKLWREITFATPRLWTDIIINLDKDPDGQFNMVKKWARRSGALPLDITIYQPDMPAAEDVLAEEEVEDEYEDVLLVLRSLAGRWHNIGLYVFHESVFHHLFNNLQGASHVGALFFPRGYIDYAPIELQYPQVCPTHFISFFFYGKDIPFEWDRLVFVDIQEVHDDEILYIIRHAKNLKHCIVHEERQDGEHFPLPPDPIISQSLIYLKTSINIFDHLTLPSLLYLDSLIADLEEFESLVECLDRSCCPLVKFQLSCPLWTVGQHLPFERLPGVTSLSISDHGSPEPPVPTRLENFLHALTRSSDDYILPRLETLSFEIHYGNFSASSWSLFSILFPKDALDTAPDVVESPSSNSISPRRPLSEVSIHLNYYDIEAMDPIMDKDTFLRLLEAKKCGVGLSLTASYRKDVLSYLARAYEIEL